MAIKYLEDTSIVTAISTDLNSLANGSRAISAAIDNNTALDIYADAELLVDFAVAPAVGALVELYLLPSVDDTNYPDGGTSLDPSSTLLVGYFVVPAAVTTDQRMVIPRIVLPPRNYKVLLKNTGGQSFGSSGHTLKLQPYKFQ